MAFERRLARARQRLQVEAEDKEPLRQEERRRAEDNADLLRGQVGDMQEQAQQEKMKRRCREHVSNEIQKRLPIDEIRSPTCTELTAELKRKSCPTSGDKKALVARVVKQTS